MMILALLLVLVLATPAHAQSFDQVFSFDFAWAVIAAFLQDSPSGARTERSGSAAGSGTAEVRHFTDGTYGLTFAGAGGDGSFRTLPAPTVGAAAGVSASIPTEFGAGTSFPLPPGVFTDPLARPLGAGGFLSLEAGGSSVHVTFSQAAHSNTFGQNYGIEFSGNGVLQSVAAPEPDVSSLLILAGVLYGSRRCVKRWRR